MASIKGIVGELGSTKETLGKAKSSVEGAVSGAEEMATAADGMDLEDVAAEIRELSTVIESAAAGVADIEGRVDELIALAEGLRTGSGAKASGGGEQPAVRDEAASTSAANNSQAGPSPGEKRAEPMISAPGGQLSAGDAPVGSSAPKPTRGRRFLTGKDAKPKRGKFEAEKKIRQAPAWRSRLNSKRSASVAAAASSGLLATASAAAHLPAPVQAVANSFVAAVTVWQAIRTNPKDDE